MRTRTRWLILLPCLAGTAWLATTADAPAIDTSLSQPTRAAPGRVESEAPVRPMPPADVEPDGPTALIPREQLYPPSTPGRSPVTRDLFSPRTWAASTPPLPAVAAEHPALPPLPYSVLGKKQEGGHWEVFLARGDRTLLARTGEVLEGIYRVDKIEPPILVLTHLPLGQAQQLPIGDPW